MHKELELKNQMEDLSRLPVFVTEICQEAGIAEDKEFGLNLVLDEAVTNVVMYAYPEGTTGKVWLEASSDAQKLVLTLQDEGKPFDPTQVPDADTSLSVDERQIGGLGIFLIRQTMDSVEYQRAGNRNVLRMTLLLDQPEE